MIDCEIVVFVYLFEKLRIHYQTIDGMCFDYEALTKTNYLNTRKIDTIERETQPEYVRKEMSKIHSAFTMLLLSFSQIFVHVSNSNIVEIYSCLYSTVQMCIIYLYMMVFSE